MPTVPKIRATNSAYDNNAALNVPGPPTVVLGDMILDITATDPDAGTSTAILPAGFTKLWESTASTGHGGWIKIFGKTAVAADVATGTAKTYNCPYQSGSQTIHNMLAVYDFNPDQLFMVNPLYGSSGTQQANIPSQAITPTDDLGLALSLWAANRNNSANAGANKGWNTIPGSWVQQLEQAGTWERTLLGSISSPAKNTAIAAVNATLNGGAATSSSWASMAVVLAPKPDAVSDLPGRFLIGAAA